MLARKEASAIVHLCSHSLPLAACLWCAFPALQGGEVEALQRSIAELSGQLEAQAAAVDAAAAERDAYRLSAQEIQERSKVSVRFKAALCGCCMLPLCFSTWLA